MEALRRVTSEGLVPEAPCSRCRATGCPWDRIADRPICPDCQELLALGEAEPLVERVEKRPCAVCRQVGTVRYLTFPLRTREAVEFDLCARHFHALLRRRLDPYAFVQLGRQLQALGVMTRQVFLLHEAFYDEHGRPLQPVPEPS
jgi:hypothetical protein